MRGLLLTVHRWAGLTIALALVVVGFTGALIPWQDQIRSLVAGDVWNAAPPFPGAAPMSGLSLMRIAEEETGGQVGYIQLEPDPDHAFSVFVSPAADGPPLDYSQLFLDPYSGEIRARVNFADLRDGAINLAPFLVSLHYSLAAGQTGQLVLGIVACVWLILSLTGLVLTWPKRNGRSSLRRWFRAWRIRRQQGPRVWLHDVHRALGLWFLPMTLVFAWSAMSFNLPTVHGPVQRAFGAQGLYRPVANPVPDPGEPMSPQEAVETGKRLMNAQAAQRGFTLREAEALSLRPQAGLIGFYARTSLDGPTERGSTVVWFDAVSGRLIEFASPYGTSTADAFDKTTRLLHTGELFGWPYKLLVSLFGLGLSAMCIAGILLWLRRSRTRPRAMSCAVQAGV